MSVLRLPASLWRGGTSKGVFLRAGDLPADPARRDVLLARLIGSPDPGGRQTDGLGNGVSSTSKVVVLSPSARPDCDVDYLFGHVDIVSGRIDWSGSCGNLSAAVGPAAIVDGLVSAPADGEARVRIWQANTGKRIDATVPMQGGLPAQTGTHRQDGLAFGGAPIVLDFLDPAGSAGAGLLPTGQAQQRLTVPGLGTLRLTLIDAGNPLVIALAAELGLDGSATPAALNADPTVLANLETLRQHAALQMGLVGSLAEAAARPATPKLAWIAPPAADTPPGVDLCAWNVSMGRLHAGFTGTATVALGAAAVSAGTVVAELLGGPLRTRPLRFAHPSGQAEIGLQLDGERIVAARLLRSARLLMRGEVWLPQP